MSIELTSCKVIFVAHQIALEGMKISRAALFVDLKKFNFSFFVISSISFSEAHLSKKSYAKISYQRFSKPHNANYVVDF